MAFTTAKECFPVAPTDSELNFMLVMFACQKEDMSSQQTDWNLLAHKMGYSKPRYAQERWWRMSRRIGIRGGSGRDDEGGADDGEENGDTAETPKKEPAGGTKRDRQGAGADRGIDGADADVSMGGVFKSPRKRRSRGTATVSPGQSTNRLCKQKSHQTPPRKMQTRGVRVKSYTELLGLEDPELEDQDMLADLRDPSPYLFDGDSE